jgi:hypothetical protein
MRTWSELRRGLAPPAAGSATAHVVPRAPIMQQQHRRAPAERARPQPGPLATHWRLRAAAQPAAGVAAPAEQPSGAQPLLRERIVKYEGITGDDFRHPLDQQVRVWGVSCLQLPCTPLRDQPPTTPHAHAPARR